MGEAWISLGNVIKLSDISSTSVYYELPLDGEYQNEIDYIGEFENELEYEGYYND